MLMNAALLVSRLLCMVCGQSEGALTHSPIHSLAAHSPLKGAAAIPVADPSDGSHTVCAVRKLAYERGLKTLPHRESHHAHSPSHFAQACKPCRHAQRCL